MATFFDGKITAAGLTDTGMKRKHNEDTFLIDKSVGVLLAADGVGGQDAGEVASQAVVESVADFLYEFDPSMLPPEDALDTSHALIREAVTNANKKIYHKNQERTYAGQGPMGATLVGVWLSKDDPDRLFVFHMGDSRIYRYRAGEFTQLTKDHTLYQQWLDEGGEGPAPKKNIITRAMGHSLDQDVDIQEQDYVEGDIYLLCSDGLTGMVDDETISGVLGRQPDLAECCQELIRLANAAGGTDNITVVLGRCATEG